MLAKISAAFSQFSDKIQEQVWFQQLRAKWDELDPQSRFYLQTASLAVGVLGILIVTGASLWSVHALKRDYQQKNDLLSQLQSANDELKRLRDAAPVPEGEEAPWKPFLEGLAASAGLPADKVRVLEEKPGAKTDLTQETLVDVMLEKINAKQLVRYTTQLESAARPVKLRSIFVDTDPSLNGEITAKLSVSGFTIQTASAAPAAAAESGSKR